MRKRTFPLSQVYRLLEPGPVVMVTTALKRRTNIMSMSWHTMMEFEPPVVGCVISNRNHTFGILFFILEVIKAWIAPLRKTSRTIHHLGRGAFMVAGRMITLPSKMK